MWEDETEDGRRSSVTVKKDRNDRRWWARKGDAILTQMQILAACESRLVNKMTSEEPLCPRPFRAAGNIHGVK